VELGRVKGLEGSFLQHKQPPSFGHLSSSSPHYRDGLDCLVFHHPSSRLAVPVAALYTQHTTTQITHGRRYLYPIFPSRRPKRRNRDPKALASSPAMLPVTTLASLLWTLVLLQSTEVVAYHRQHAVPIGEHSRRPYGEQGGEVEQYAPWDESLHRLHARQSSSGSSGGCAFLASAAAQTSGMSPCLFHGAFPEFELGGMSSRRVRRCRCSGGRGPSGEYEPADSAEAQLPGEYGAMRGI
jgi:hypothetical protein